MQLISWRQDGASKTELNNFAWCSIMADLYLQSAFFHDKLD